MLIAKRLWRRRPSSISTARSTLNRNNGIPSIILYCGRLMLVVSAIHLDINIDIGVSFEVWMIVSSASYHIYTTITHCSLTHSIHILYTLILYIFLHISYTFLTRLITCKQCALFICEILHIPNTFKTLQGTGPEYRNREDYRPWKTSERYYTLSV